jgi:hypothetical protein
MPEIEIQFRSEAEYRRLRAIRDKYGVQWRGMLIQGAKRLEGRELRFALVPDNQARERRQSEPDVTDRGDRSVEPPADSEPHELSGPDTATTDRRLDPRLFDANRTLQTAEAESNPGDGGAVELGEERVER